MQEGYYKEELPRQFKTWLEFLDMITRLGIGKTHEDVLIHEIIKKGLPIKKTKQIRYSIQYIKEMALEELLSTRLEKEDVMWFTNEIEAGLRQLGHTQGSAIFKAVADVKRILLTLAPK